MKRYNYMTQDDLNFKKLFAALELGSALGWFSSDNGVVEYKDFVEKDKKEVC